MNFLKAISTWYFLVSVVFHCCSEAVPERARVDSLPGYNGTLPSEHYAGYVAVDEDHGKYLYYYFVTSQGDLARDPVVLWLNGGPGCSSFDGFIYEHGPFSFEVGEKSGSLPKLHLNPFSWSKVSSVIYLDSPCGVGYSYSDTVDDYSTGDVKTASDTHAFLLKWFKEYPEFLSNPFYISGESYAGIYVPTLAQEIANGIEAGMQPALNFKGYMVGNGVTDTIFDGNALVPFVHGMGLISDDLFQEVENACNGSYWNPVHINCFSKLQAVDRDDRVAKVWLNDQYVRKAIHAQSEEICGSWEICTDRISFNHDAGSMINYHINLTTKGYRALIYSGDHDMCVPFTGTEAWTRSLGYAVIDKWRPWIVDGQVAGYTQGYEHNFTFATIKGAGHTVPEYKPQEALAFYTRWLAGEPL